MFGHPRNAPDNANPSWLVATGLAEAGYETGIVGSAEDAREVSRNLPDVQRVERCLRGTTILPSRYCRPVGELGLASELSRDMGF